MSVPPSESLLRTYWQFLRSPSLVQPCVSLPNRTIIRHLWQLYSVHLLIVMVLGIAISLFVPAGDHLLLEVFENLSIWLIISMSVVLIPTLEEVIFRLPLRGAIQTLMPTLSLLVWFLGSWFAGRGIAIVMGCVLVALNCWVWSTPWRKVNAKIEQFYAHYPRWIFYGAAIAFGAIHITNYEPTVWPLLPLVVLPQFVVGMWFGFMRSRYGFIWSAISHGFYNGTLLMPFMLFKLLGSKTLKYADFAELDPQTLTFTDQILVVVVGLYFLVGVGICAAIAVQLMREAFNPQPGEIDSF